MVDIAVPPFLCIAAAAAVVVSLSLHDVIALSLHYLTADDDDDATVVEIVEEVPQ